MNMKYPCIRYDRSKIDITHANDMPYKLSKGYSLTVIYNDPDDTLSDSISKLQHCSFEKGYKTNNLYHDVFNIYF